MNDPLHTAPDARFHVACPLVRNGWTIRKEFYADGPSMFTWIAQRDGAYEEFNTRRDALAHAEKNPS